MDLQWYNFIYGCYLLAGDEDVINYYKTINGKTRKIAKYEEKCWISCISPSEDEINYLISNFKIEPEFVRSALDEEESTHIDSEEGTIFITIDSPVVNKSGKNLVYYTTPLSIIITPDDIITISLRENAIIGEFARSLIKNADTNKEKRFALQIMLRMANKYLQYLNH